jgi:hypothetical protein
MYTEGVQGGEVDVDVDADADADVDVDVDEVDDELLTALAHVLLSMIVFVFSPWMASEVILLQLCIMIELLTPSKGIPLLSWKGDDREKEDDE